LVWFVSFEIKKLVAVSTSAPHHVTAIISAMRVTLLRT
jgi:hypothetical protein